MTNYKFFPWKSEKYKELHYYHNNKKNVHQLYVFFVGREGVEPSQCLHRRILSPLRLPIPPPPQHYLFYLTLASRQG